MRRTMCKTHPVAAHGLAIFPAFCGISGSTARYATFSVCLFSVRYFRLEIDITIKAPDGKVFQSINSKDYFNNRLCDLTLPSGGRTQTAPLHAHIWQKTLIHNGTKYLGVQMNTYYRYALYDKITENSYYTFNVYRFQYEPIQWRILTTSENSAYIMSDIALDSFSM